MRYYKIIKDGYILAVGTGNGNVEITKTEYNTILTEINNMPFAPQGYEHKLKEDLTWDLCKNFEDESLDDFNEISEEEYEKTLEDEVK